MKNLVPNLSPLEQAHRDQRVPLAPSKRQLSRADQARLRRILQGKYGFVPNKGFSRSNAERKLFEEASAVAKPDTSWYHPVMEMFGEDRHRFGNKQVGTVLLTAAEESVLFLQFNFCRYKVCKLKTKIGKKAVQAAVGRELLAWHDKAETLRDQIAQTNLALVLAMAKRMRMTDLEFADLVSEGNMALLRAIDKFDAARGFKFSTYGCRAILKAFSRAGIKHTKYRNLFPTDFDPALERSDNLENKRASHEDDCADEVKQILINNRADLTDIEQEVIEHRFNIDKQGRSQEDVPNLTLEQVGRIIGVTKERVRQIQNKALAKIRVTLEDDYLR